MATIPGDVMHKILDLAIEDATPLCDVVAEVRACNPAAADANVIELSRRFVRHLLDRGFVRIELEMDPSGTKRVRQELPEEEWRPRFTDDMNWYPIDAPRTTGGTLTICATPNGEQAVYRCNFPRMQTS